MTGDTGRVPAEDIAAFASELSFEALSEEVVEQVTKSIVDTVGVTLAGSTTDAGKLARELTTDFSAEGSATVIGSDSRTSPTDAAFANGTAAHCLDFDDTSAHLHLHPSAAMVPAIFAVAGDRCVSGKRAITAFVAGFEAMNYVHGPINPEHYERGWHATSTIGAFGAAVAAATVLDLDRKKIAHAVNIGASTAAGLKRNFGSMTKPMHAGQAARAGVTTAMLAERGFTAFDDALTAERGFFDLYRGSNEPDFSAFPELGDPFAIVEHGVNLKKYPCCYFTHSAIAAAETVAHSQTLGSDEIDSVHVLASRAARETVVYDNPTSGMEAKFSMPYTVASALVRDRVGLEAFEDENINHAETRTIQERVTFEADPDRPYGDHGAVVTVETTSGETLQHEQPEPPGTLDVPLTEEGIRDKYRMCASRVLSTSDVESSYEWLLTLSEQDDISNSHDLLAP